VIGSLDRPGDALHFHHGIGATADIWRGVAAGRALHAFLDRRVAAPA
jgi:hypothetical protein